jgi:hypothetical protein
MKSISIRRQVDQYERETKGESSTTYSTTQEEEEEVSNSNNNSRRSGTGLGRRST